MVERLKLTTPVSPAVEAALREVPRHLFLPGVDLERVYSGDAIVTRTDDAKRPTSSSSQVAIMAPMLELLELAPGMRVLEIGAGSGYNAALPDAIVGPGGAVATIELESDLAEEARAHLAAAGRERVRVICADGWLGDPDGSVYDRIELTANSADVAPAWSAQLVDRGILVMPLRFRSNGGQAVVALRKEGAGFRSTRCVMGGFMEMRGLGAARSASALVGDLSVTPADIAPRVLELVKGPPRVELGDELDRDATWLLAIVRDLVTIRREGQPVAYGIYDADPEGLAVMQATDGAVTGKRVLRLGYGALGPLERVRDAIAELRGRTIGDLRVHALPTGSGRPEGDLLFEHPNYAFGVSFVR
jgi:protein-L-isoaspartate(D-aspartate) O-methyltransferase